MGRKLVIKYKRGNMPFILLLLTCSSKWLFEDILGYSILEAGLVFVSACLLIFIHWNGCINKESIVWVPYVAAIIFSLLLSPSGINLWGRALIVFLTVLFAVLCDYSRVDFARIFQFLIGLGCFHAVLIIAQFILKEKFNSVIFPLMVDNSRKYALAYYREGYYFGILDSPHEVSGIVGLSLAIKSFKTIFCKIERTVTNYIIIIILLFAFFLTQKKGVILCCAVSFIFSLLIYYPNKKSVIKSISLVFGLAIGVLVSYYLITTYSSIPLFKRLGKFIISLQSGKVIDGGRFKLYEIAINEWQAQKVTGIGWRHFKQLTVDKYGYSYAHEVNCDYLQFLCELGIVGFVLVMITILGNTAAMIRLNILAGRKDLSENARTILFGAVFIQIFTVIYAAIEIPFYDVWYFSVYVLSSIIICKYKKVFRNKSEFLIGDK